MSELTDKLQHAVFGTAMELPPGDWPAVDADLFELGLDSMTILRILVVIEEQLGVKLSERDLDPDKANQSKRSKAGCGRRRGEFGLSDADELGDLTQSCEDAEMRKAGESLS